MVEKRIDINMEMRKMNDLDDRAFSAITGMVSSMCAARHVNLEEIAERTRVFSGYNGKKRFSPAQLLALLLMWCTNGHTLRELAATVDIEIGFPLTDTGLLGRFRKSAAFLDEICRALGLPYGDVAAACSLLESDGFICMDLLQRCSIDNKKAYLCT